MSPYHSSSRLRPVRLSEVAGRDVLETIQDIFTSLSGCPIAFYDERGEEVLPASNLSEAMIVIERSVKALREIVGDRTKVEWPISGRIALTRRTYGSFLVEYEAPIMYRDARLGAVAVYGRPASGAIIAKREVLEIEGKDEFARAIESSTALPALGEPEATTVIPKLLWALERFIEYGIQTRDLRDIVERSLNLHKASQALVSTLDLQEMLNLITKLVTETLRVRSCSLRLLDESRKNLRIGAVHNLSESYLGKGAVPVANSLIDQQALAGRGVAVYDVSKDPRILYPREMAAEGLVSLLCAPLRVKEQSIGVLRAYSAEPREFTALETRIFEALGNQAAAAIENARLLSAAKENERQEQELAFAARVQKGLLPQDRPRVAGYDFGAINVPHSQVGGDFYDFVTVQDNHMGLVIADGSGKGVPAALLMASTYAALEVQIHTTYRTKDIIGRLNKFLCKRIATTGSFVTLFYAALDLRARRLTYTTAGHPAPLLARGAAMKELPGEGLLLGVNPDVEYEEHQITLQGGDVLVLYTDGVVDAENIEGARFGEERLREVLRANVSLAAQELAGAIYDAVRRHAGSVDLTDDFTLTVTKVL
ncbi:MAG: GAF domain-containing SpoIIE family protein phosphatase [Planctomycetota bacterium]